MDEEKFLYSLLKAFLGFFLRYLVRGNHRSEESVQLTFSVNTCMMLAVVTFHCTITLYNTLVFSLLVIGEKKGLLILTPPKLNFYP